MNHAPPRQLARLGKMAPRFDSLQFVAFTRSSPASSAIEYWQDLFGDFPASYQQQPLGGSTCSGTKEGFTINIQVQINRVDLIVGPPEPKLMELENPPYVDDPEKAASVGRALIKRTAAKLEVHRPAVVFQTSDECGSIEEALDKLGARVPGLPRPNGTADLHFQVTVPRPSEVHGEITINRLARWNTARRFLLQVGTQFSGVAPTTSALVLSEYADVYASDQPVVGNARFDDVVDEIATEAMNILSNGYAALS